MRRPVVVVPVRGLPIVALVLIGVVVAIARDARWSLMFCHVVGGGLWTGIDLFVGFVVGPIIGRMSIPARVEFSTRFMPKMLLLMPTLVTMTLASGWQLSDCWPPCIAVSSGRGFGGGASRMRSFVRRSRAPT